MSDALFFPMVAPGERLPPVYNEDGVDLSLIRWMLSLTMEERLLVLQDHINTINMIRDEITIS
ncbi:hypothetical protein [Acanthopleuribacter pedis]|uniref:Uncharacterized protein n=1 Tax=Acanthopleuribacter pedis TaxID=442870 RepID=A0A8J7QBY5_9BACT|nr:hypothetical protein [Acanthopleuribacter pedis]MBO1322816.1 hypothetical protein [Acanthopleuribacter pedis]